MALLLTSERAELQARYQQLEDADRDRGRSLIRYYILMILFAAAPFTLEHLAGAFTRVWAFGGLWLAVVVWVYLDRMLGAYGESVCERVLCVRQMNQIRAMVADLFPLYRRHSLLPVTGTIAMQGPVFRSGDPAHIPQSRLEYTVIYFKILSLFPPLYFILFASLFAFPTLLVDTRQTHAVVTTLAIGWALSFVGLVWTMTIHNRCRSIVEGGFRARRVGPGRPWPLFPLPDIMVPVTGRERALSYGMGLAVLLATSLCGLSLGIMLGYYLAWDGSSLWVPALWLSGSDYAIAGLTVLALAGTYLLAHWETGARLERAKLGEDNPEALRPVPSRFDPFVAMLGLPVRSLVSRPMWTLVGLLFSGTLRTMVWARNVTFRGLVMARILKRDRRNRRGATPVPAT